MPPIAFALALAAIVLWSSLAALSLRLQPLQPFLLAGLGLGIGGLLSARHWRAWELPMRERLIGLGGILGYHVLYFQALRQPEAVVSSWSATGSGRVIGWRRPRASPAPP